VKRGQKTEDRREKIEERGKTQRIEDRGNVACVRWYAVVLNTCTLGVDFLHGVRFRHPTLQKS
jgi:hypothetical protein